MTVYDEERISQRCAQNGEKKTVVIDGEFVMNNIVKESRASALRKYIL